MSARPVSGNLTFANLDRGREASSHTVNFYENDPFIVESLAHHLGKSLTEGDSAVIIATAAHRNAIEERLAAGGLDIAALVLQGRFASLDASETLAKFCVDGVLDAARFEEVIGKLLRAMNASSPNHFTRAFGEMVVLLWADGKRDAVMRLEALWSQLATRIHFSLCCAYPINAFSSARDSEYLAKLCAQHSHVIPAESFTALDSSSDRERTIALLQQRASLLESEMVARNRVEQELRAKLAELAENDRRTHEFLAMLGHELRNPLCAILNAITAADLNPASRERAIEIARRQTVQLARLVDDLLDVARITQGRITLRKEPLGIISLLGRSIEETRAAAELRGQPIAVNVPFEVNDVRVDVDPARMQQCISNLIHNAIKFSQSRGRIDVSLCRSEKEVAIRVRDRGIGIAPEMLSRVFDLFAQGNVSIDRAQGGLGLGLTLVRKLVAMHGGRVEARSAGVGRGSEFEIALPILDNAGRVAATSLRATTNATSRVLVIEDNRDAADSMQMLLELLGHEVKLADDGFRALEILGEEKFDAVLIDIGLPEMDGYTLAGRLRALPDGRNMRLIALTGYGQDDDRRRALAAGFDQHLVKPVDIDRLQALLAHPPEVTRESL